MEKLRLSCRNKRSGVSVRAEVYSHERIDTFFDVVHIGGHVDEHERLRAASDRVLHQHGEFVVAVRYVGLLSGQGVDHVPEGRERLIDAVGFLERKNKKKGMKTKK